MRNMQNRGSLLGLEHQPAPRAASETRAFAVRWPCRRQSRPRVSILCQDSECRIETVQPGAGIGNNEKILQRHAKYDLVVVRASSRRRFRMTRSGQRGNNYLDCDAAGHWMQSPPRLNVLYRPQLDDDGNNNNNNNLDQCGRNRVEKKDTVVAAAAVLVDDGRSFSSLATYYGTGFECVRGLDVDGRVHKQRVTLGNPALRWGRGASNVKRG